MSLTNQKEVTLFKTDNKISILTLLFNFIVHTCVFIFMYKIFIKNGDTTVKKEKQQKEKQQKEKQQKEKQQKEKQQKEKQQKEKQQKEKQQKEVLDEIKKIKESNTILSNELKKLKKSFIEHNYPETKKETIAEYGVTYSSNEEYVLEEIKKARFLKKKICVILYSELFTANGYCGDIIKHANEISKILTCPIIMCEAYTPHNNSFKHASIKNALEDYCKKTFRLVGCCHGAFDFNCYPSILNIDKDGIHIYKSSGSKPGTKDPEKIANYISTTGFSQGRRQYKYKN